MDSNELDELYALGNDNSDGGVEISGGDYFIWGNDTMNNHKYIGAISSVESKERIDEFIEVVTEGMGGVFYE